jgi:hypothetical protein
MADDPKLDEWTRPAQDPSSGWEKPGPGDIPEAIPEADSPEVEEAWEEADAMDGQAPSG